VQAGERFAAAVASGTDRGELDAARGEGAFDPAAALQRLVLAGAIVDFR
jgi:hypothetical protein